MQRTTDKDDIMLAFNVPLRITKLELAGLVRYAEKHSDPKSVPVAISGGSSVQRAKWLYQFEVSRRKLPGLETSLGDPSWMILLDLYVRDTEGRSTSVSSATLASVAPPTTGLRHICVLESKGYIQRVAHPSDERSMLLSLTEFGRRAVSDVLDNAG